MRKEKEGDRAGQQGRPRRGRCAADGKGLSVCLLAELTEVHDVVPADGAVVHDDVPRPERHGVPLLDLEPLLLRPAVLPLQSRGARVLHLHVRHGYRALHLLSVTRFSSPHHWCGARSPRPRPLQARAPSGRPEPSFFWRARPSPQNQDDPEQNRGGWQHHGRRTVRERRRWIGVKEVGPRGGGQPEHCEREGRKARRRRSQGP